MAIESAGPQGREESVSAQEIAHRKMRLEIGRSSHINKFLLSGTLVCVAFALVAIWYANRRQLNNVAANLLVLADQAEADADWPLFRSRLQRYLAIRSDDTDVTQRLADTYHARAETIDEIRAGMKLYSRCLASYPRLSEDSLEIHLKYLSMQARIDPVASIQALDELVPKIQVSQDIEDVSSTRLRKNAIDAIRLRIMLREQLLPMLVDAEQLAEREHLIEDYEQLLATDHRDPRLGQNLSFQYQLHANSVASTDAELAEQMREKADQIMNDVTTANMDDIDVLMHRFEYGRRFSNEGQANTSDLQRILELDRSNPHALLYLAMTLSEQSSETGESSPAALNAAKEFLQESIEHLPKEPHVLVSLANIQSRLNDENAASETLMEAAALYPESDIVCVAQIRRAIAQKRFDDAENGIVKLRRIADKARTYDRSRAQEINRAKVQKSHADVLEAEWLVESKPNDYDRSRTIALLKNVDMARLQSHGRTDVLQQAAYLLARLKLWESAIEPLERARTTGTILISSSYLLARCYQQSDDDQRAMEIYREIASRRLPTSQSKMAWYCLGMINLQTRSDDDQRSDRLQEAQQALDRITTLAPASLEAFLLKTYLQLATGKVDKSTAIAQLNSAESRFSNEIQYWLLCTNVYRSFDDFARLRVAEQRLAKVVGSMPDAMVLGDKEFADEIAESLDLTTQLSQKDLDHLREVAGSWRDFGHDQRLAMIRRWCDEVPGSIAARFSLANVGIATKQVAIVDEAVESLRKIDTGSDSFLKIAEVHRDLIEFSSGKAVDGDQAKRKAAALLDAYPNHPVFLQLSALCEETCADLTASSDHYRQAVEQGAGLAAIEGRIRTLVHQRKWDQALEYIEQLPMENWTQYDRIELVVHVLCHHRKFDDAIRIISAMANESPHSAQEHDSAQEHYLMAVTLMSQSAGENIVQAHQHLQEAVRKEPANLGYRIALFYLQINHSPELWSYQSYVSANRIRWLLQSYDNPSSPAWSALILAETLRFEGRIAEAEDLFRKAIAIESNLRESSWIPRPILSRNATATIAPVTPAIAWLAGTESARTLSAIQALMHGYHANDLEISEGDLRLQALLASRNDQPLTAIQFLESISDDERGVGDHLLLAALFDRTGNRQAAFSHRADCLEKSQQYPDVVDDLLNDAFANENLDFAQRCVDVQKSQSDSSVQIQLTQARIDLEKGPFPADFDQWMSEQQQVLTNEWDRKLFFNQILNELADQGKAKLAARMLERSVKDVPEDETKAMLWVASQKALTARAMRFLNDDDRLPSASVLTEMLYQLIQHLPESSRHRERVSELAIRLSDSSVELTPVDWTKLAYVLEHLQLPELAVAACGKALPDDGSTSWVEHYIIWLRGGYFGGLPTAQSELDRLIRVFGPRDDLMDTRAVLLLRDGKPEAAADISRELALHDTLNRTYQANDRLASALMRPKHECEKALIDVEQTYSGDLSLVARKILRDHLTLD